MMSIKRLQISLNDNAQHQPNLHIATRNDSDDDSDLPTHQHVSDDNSKDPENTPIKRRYTSTGDLRVVSCNTLINPYYA